MLLEIIIKKLHDTTNTINVQNINSFLDELLIPCTPDEDIDNLKSEKKGQDQMVS